MSALVDALCAPPGDIYYDAFNAASFLFDNAAAFCGGGGGAGIVVAPAPAQHQQQQLVVAGAAPDVAAAAAAGGVEMVPGDTQAAASSSPPSPPPPRARKRRRRARSCKSREETESQRMTHIAVERNRRRQMNEYLTVLRSLMPDSYVQRGDQASIVGGAIEFVKELEQQLQSLEVQRRALLAHHRPGPQRAAAAGHPPCVESSATTTTSTSNCSSSVTTEDAPDAPPPFSQFFSYPQYAWCHSSPAAAENGGGGGGGGGRPGVADIEVSLVETHASLRVMTPRRPGQLLRLVAGLQALRLTVLHLTVTTMDSLVLYSISAKVEEGCELTTVDDIAAAAHHVLCIIDADATSHYSQLLLADEQ